MYLGINFKTANTINGSRHKNKNRTHTYPIKIKTFTTFMINKNKKKMIKKITSILIRRFAVNSVIVSSMLSKHCCENTMFLRDFRLH